MVEFIDVMGALESKLVLLGDEPPVEEEPDPAEGEAGRKPSQLEKAFAKLKLERTPKSVFEARADLARRAQLSASPAEKASDAAGGGGNEVDEKESKKLEQQQAKEDSERLGLLCVAGEWEAVSDSLSQLDPAEAEGLFTHLCTALSTADTVALPEEVLVIADVSPVEPSPKAERALAGLLRSARTRGGDEELTRRLREGTRWLGGGTPKARGRAAQWLIAAGALGAANEFLDPLPPPDEQTGARNPEDLRRHALVALHRGLQAERYGERQAELEAAWDWLDEASRAPDLKPALIAELVAARERVAEHVDAELAARWRESLFTDRGGEEGAKALAALAGGLAELQAQNQMGIQRYESWKEIHRLAEALLLARGIELDVWKAPLAAVTSLYLHDAQLSRTEAEAQRSRQNAGNFYFGNFSQAPSQKQLLETLPSLLWLRTIEPSQGRRLASEAIQLLASSDEVERAHRWLGEAVLREPDSGEDLVASFLRAWCVALDPTGRSESGVESFNPFGTTSVFFSGGVTYYMGGAPNDFSNGLPVTRARQEESLDQLAGALERFRAIGVNEPEPSAVVEAFAACHSPAEVYGVADIERVFGPIPALPGGVAAALSSAMRQRLAKQWRDTKVIEATGARRSSEEIDAEIERGYQLAGRLAERALGAQPDSWNFGVANASLAFEHAEFQYSLDPELETYAPLREAAFESFAGAARLYERALEDGRSAPSAEAHLAWFRAALGASEAGYLTRETQPDVDQVERVRGALDALDEHEEKRHTGLFAKALTGELLEVPPVAKQRFARHAARVVGSHEEAESLRKLLDFYESIAREVELLVEVDGSTDVGFEAPFGVRLWLASSSALAREGGGFSRYLQNQVQTPATGVPVDYRDRFEEGLRQALFEGFEVEGLQFLPPEAPARSYGRDHWERKPMAYLVLRAKDPAIDRIPTLGIDLDFSDGQGQVAISVQSTPILIDAKPTGLALRKLDEPRFEFTLDDRDLDEGRISIEARATAFGALPEVSRLLTDLQQPGFEGPEIADLPANLIEIDPARQPPAPLAERTATLTYTVATGGDGTFRFPSVVEDSAEVSYRRFADMDIVDLEGPVTPLESWQTTSTNWTPWITLGALLLVAFGVFSLGRSSSRDDSGERTGPPSQPSPVVAVGYLENLASDGGNRLSPELLAELESETEQLRAMFFAPPNNGEANGIDPGELGSRLRHWAALAEKRN